ncbi:MAG: hypothetical protein ACE3JK_06005 [Sporolactobacillus sp.]
MNTMDTYFKLSDTAGRDVNDFNTLIDLFDPNGAVEPASGSSFIGRQEISNFFTSFFDRNIKLRHVWVTEKQPNGYKTTWAVAGITKEGRLISLRGTDYAEINSEDRISHLKVIIEN